MLYFIRQADSITLQTCPVQSTAPLWSDQIQLREPFYKDHVTIVLHNRRLPIVAETIWKPSHKKIYNQYILISNFQKAMRRKAIDACLSTGIQLLGQDATVFLRRLAVVLLEDSLLHPRLYCEVVWLMLATGKGYKLRVADVQIIADAIVTGLESRSRYNLLKEARHPPDAAALPSTTVAAIRLRAAVGGMKFDTAFLGRLADRLADADLPCEEDWYSIALGDISEFSVKKHMIAMAIDFHCCPFILDTLDDLLKSDRTVIKNAIWWHWSSLNERLGEDDMQAATEAAERAATLQIWEACQDVMRVFSKSQIELLDKKAERVKSVQTLDKWFGKCLKKAEKA